MKGLQLVLSDLGKEYFYHSIRVSRDGFPLTEKIYF